MSRGLGRAQRFVLDYLTEQKTPKIPWRRWKPVPEISRAFAGDKRPTAAEAESVRRAVRSLAGKGLVDVAESSSGGLVRVPLTDHDRELEEAERARREATWTEDGDMEWPLPRLKEVTRAS